MHVSMCEFGSFTCVQRDVIVVYKLASTVYVRVCVCVCVREGERVSEQDRERELGGALISHRVSALRG